MAVLVPNVIDWDLFADQASVDESSSENLRFTWRRGDAGELLSGTVVEGEPGFTWPLDVSVPASAEIEEGHAPVLASIDTVASADDLDAWRSAALHWLDSAEQQYKDAGEVWMQLEWGGALAPDQIPPGRQSLVNKRTFGSIEVLAGVGLVPGMVIGVDPKGPGLGPDALATWPAYFKALRALIPTMSVSQAVGAQIALRGVAWTMQSLAALGKVGDHDAHICELARAWRETPTADCAKREVEEAGAGAGAPNDEPGGIPLGVVATVLGLVAVWWWMR